MISDGWLLFEETVGQAGMGELPQLLRSVKASVTPTPMPMPTPTDVKEGEEGEGEEASTSGVSVTQVREGGPESPVKITIKMEGGKVSNKYKCPQCDTVKATKRGVDSHIRSVHTLKAFVCCLCDFTTYNLDSLQRHEKGYK